MPGDGFDVAGGRRYRRAPGRLHAGRLRPRVGAEAVPAFVAALTEGYRKAQPAMTPAVYVTRAAAGAGALAL